MHKIALYYDDTSRKEEVSSFINSWGNDEKVIAIHTSGSTGNPKNIELAKEKMQISARKTLEYFKIEKGSSALLCLSLETIAGKMMLVRSLIGELKLHVVTVSTNPILALKNPIDFVALVPMQLEAAVDTAFEKLKSIKTILVGGAPVSEELIQKLKDKKITVFQSYGMTETISHVAIRKIGFETEEYYQALPGITFSSDEQRLIIDYPEVLSEKLRTNDCVNLIDSKHFQYLNRYDFIINTGGIKVNPEEIELKLKPLLKKPFFIWFMKDVHLGQKIVLVVQEKVNLKLKKKDFTHYLNKYEIPKNYCQIKDFVLSKSQKIDRIKTMQTIDFKQWKTIE
jgi:O-succinylbenzoic acid--CoA ligase